MGLTNFNETWPRLNQNISSTRWRPRKKQKEHARINQWRSFWLGLRLRRCQEVLLSETEEDKHGQPKAKHEETTLLSSGEDVSEDSNSGSGPSQQQLPQGEISEDWEGLEEDFPTLQQSQALMAISWKCQDDDVWKGLNALLTEHTRVKIVALEAKKYGRGAS